MMSTTIPAAIAFGSVAVVGAGTYAALSAGAQIFGRTLIAGADPYHLALTYDDGPNPAATPQLLDILAEQDVRATFFVIGQFVRAEPALTRRIAEAGHVLGNHTMTHPWLAWQSGARIREELADCSRVIEDVAGVPVRLFRPPHGARRPYVLSVARALDMTTVQWNIMPRDWQAVDAATLLLRMQRGIGGNRLAGVASNILLHDGSDRGLGADRLPTLEATRQLLALCDGSRHRFVTPEDWRDEA